MSEDRLAIIIPTKDRPLLLQRLLESIRQQSVLPAQIIVVDGSAASVEPSLAPFAELRVRYLRTEPPSLTKQKNLGIAALDSEVTLVAFLDDDLMLEPRALEAMLAFWASADPTVGGAGLTVLPDRPHHWLGIKRFFALDAPEDGRMLPSGYNTALRPHDSHYATQWLSGGATVWRRDVVNRYPFDEWFRGYNYPEDVDYSLQVTRDYALYMVPGARAWHRPLSVRLSGQLRFGIWQVRNRWYLARKHPQVSRAWCLWSLVGQSLLNATAGIVRWGPGGVLRTCGNLIGWIVIASGVKPHRTTDGA